MPRTPSAAEPSVPELEPDVPASKVPFDPSIAMRVFLASLSFGAGAIHLAMVPAHAKESMFMGVSFALSGWFAIIFGAIILARPTRLWVQLTILANLVFIGSWALSRTVGLPAFTGDAGVEKASSIDIMCVAFEAMLIVGCIAVLMAPDMLKNLKQGALVAAGIVPVAILVATTSVMASPSVADHGHDGEVAAAGAMDHGDMDHSAGAMDHGAGAMDHGAGAMDHGAGAMDHGAPAVNASARCDWDLNTQAFWKQNPPAESGPAGSHADHQHSATGGDKAGQGNADGVQSWAPLTDRNQCQELTTDIATMKAVAEKYPTAADAKAAGCLQVTTYVPGIASHWACLKNWDTKLDLNNPEMLLYGGTSLNAPIVGLSYYSLATDAPQTDPSAPLWVKYMPSHYHEGLCVKNGLVIGGDNSDQASCASRGGVVMGKTGWMGHYWMPNCDSPDGVFSAENPRLDINVAKYNDDPANQTDPAKLQQDPCTGSKLPTSADDSFGPPPTVSNNGGGESAAGH